MNTCRPKEETAGEPGAAWGRIDRKRLLIWAGIGFGIPGVVILLVHLAEGGGSSAFTVRNELPVKAVMVFFLSLATWIVSRMEKRLLDEYGIPLGQAFGGRFWEGTVWRLCDSVDDSAGLADVGPLSNWLRGAGWRRDREVGAGLGDVSGGVAEQSVGVSLLLAVLDGSAHALLAGGAVLSAVFGVAHVGNKGENLLGIVQVVATGLVFCLMIRRTGNLWFVIGFHAAWDWAETFFYDTPDSGLFGAGRFLNSSVQGPSWLTGGSAAPEESVFAFFALALCALLVHLRFPKAVYPHRPT